MIPSLGSPLVSASAQEKTSHGEGREERRAPCPIRSQTSRTSPPEPSGRRRPPPPKGHPPPRHSHPAAATPLRTPWRFKSSHPHIASEQGFPARLLPPR